MPLKYSPSVLRINGRGRDGSYLPPAQIRTCGITAYGSCLGNLPRSNPQGKGVHLGAGYVVICEQSETEPLQPISLAASPESLTPLTTDGRPEDTETLQVS